MAELERSIVIELLNRLGARSDDEALAAARELHETVTAAGMKWDDLLISDSPPEAAAGAEEESDEDAADADEASDGEGAPDEDATLDEEEQPSDKQEAERPDEPLAANPEEDTRTIKRLLALKNLSKETRDDLAGYQRDIAAGRLTEMDSRYISALARRLGA